MPETPSSLLSASVDPDSDSLVRAREGDPDAFCALCRAYEARVLRQAMVLCGNESMAEDLAQDTFLAAWKSLHRYHGRCAFFTWLCAILIHLYQSKRREIASGARFTTLVADHDADSFTDPGIQPDQTVLAAERAALMRACLARLSRKHRDVVFLRFYVNESLEEIAATLNCSVGTVKSRLFHGLEKLRQMKQLARSEKEVFV